MTTQISQQEIQQTAVRLGIPDHPFVARRIARAYNLVETNKVNEISHDDGFYRVHSQYDDKIYTVELNHGHPHCTCPDNERTIFCKHSIASMMVARKQERKAPVLTVKETAHTEFVKASWVVTDGKRYTNVWQDLNGKICCVCGAYYEGDCVHKQAMRRAGFANGKPSDLSEYSDAGNGSNRIVNDCGTETAKALQDNLNGNNGTGDTQSPVHHQLDIGDPFQEAEQLDIDQIEGRSNGDLVHVLSNGEYVVSYRGIMALAEQHGVTFEAARHDETHTVIAYGRCGSNSRASGKPINGSEMTAVELAKRNAARQLLSLVDIKALEKKAQLEAEFDWEKAKAKCLELLPEANLNSIIHDLVNDGKLEQKHPSDYSRREWLLIFDTVRKDAENNGGGDNTPSSTNNDWQAKLNECYDLAYDDIRVSWLKDDMIREGRLPKHPQDWTDNDFQTLKEAVELDKSLHGRGIGHWRIEKQVNWGDNWVWARRYRFELTPVRQRCFWCESTEKTCLRADTHRQALRDFGIEWHRYDFKLSLCFDCFDDDDITKEKLTEKFDRLYHGVYDASDDETTVEMPQTAEEFSQVCQEAVEKVTDDNMVEANEQPLESEGERKIQMDRDLKTWLVESDGTRKAISCREIAEQYDSFEKQIIVRLKQAIDSGMDIATIDV